jgi:hypothetical protein
MKIPQIGSIYYRLFEPGGSVHHPHRESFVCLCAPVKPDMMGLATTNSINVTNDMRQPKLYLLFI